VVPAPDRPPYAARVRVGILTSGGDCPGLNAVIRAVVRRIVAEGGEVIGFHDAWRGVIERSWEVLDIEACRGILPRGGTILGTSRISAAREPGGRDAAWAVMDELGLDGYIVVGGDGSLAGALALHEDGVPTIGVPKTIDNDIDATEMTFGFDTAVSIATEAIDRLHSTAESHDRVMVVEVMGRDTGHIAARAGLAGGATAILVPEDPFDLDEVCGHLLARHGSGRWASIVVVAEGARPAPGTLELPEPPIDRFGHQKLGGVGQAVCGVIEERTGYETRLTVLGHVQRGGTPTAYDRVLATRYGVAAAEAAIDGAWGDMVVLAADRIVRRPMAGAVGHQRRVADDLLAVVRRFAVG